MTWLANPMPAPISKRNRLLFRNLFHLAEKLAALAAHVFFPELKAGEDVEVA